MKTTLRPWQVLILLFITFNLVWPGRSQTFFPGVILTQPTNGAAFFAPTDVQLFAHVTEDPDNGVTVKFFANSNLLGVVSNGAVAIQGGRNFAFDWTNVASGTYALAAESVRRLSGAPAWSRTNTVTVVQGHYISLELVQPTNGTIYPGPTNIDLLAGGLDTNGSVAFVEFFDGAKSIGFATNGLVLDPGPPPGFPAGWVTGDRAYLLRWTNQTIGTHTLTAAMLDTNGEIAYSPPLTVIIGSNIPPQVALTAPPNHAVFYAPMNLPMVAYANSPDGSIATVQFFAGTNHLGFGTPFQPPVEQPLDGAGVAPPSSSPILHFFIVTWTNPPVGSFDLTAVATDGLGFASTSAPVAVSILASLTPPSTNLPDVVSVVATDPVAVASTNCWIWRGLTNGVGTWSQWTSPIAIWRFFTNCGPKDATFTVRRIGSSANDLTVNYDLSGSATNGIDYEFLPGSITLPAGENTAAITVVPIENGSNYIRTVILTLDPSTNSPLGYLVGFDSKAAALIVDDKLLGFPEAILLGGGEFHFTLSGPEGAWFHVDYTTNLQDWTPLCTNQVIDGAIDFVDPNANASPTRLYRAVPLTGTPSN